MHLPAQYDRMPRGAERESHTQGTHGYMKRNNKTTLKPGDDRWRIFSAGERGEEVRSKLKRMDCEKGRAADRERGLTGLPVPPVSWDYLLLQSTVAQQKQREQQNYTHLPALTSPRLPIAPSYY